MGKAWIFHDFPWEICGGLAQKEPHPPNIFHSLATAGVRYEAMGFMGKARNQHSSDW